MILSFSFNLQFFSMLSNYAIYFKRIFYKRWIYFIFFDVDARTFRLEDLDDFTLTWASRFSSTITASPSLFLVSDLGLCLTICICSRYPLTDARLWWWQLHTSWPTLGWLPPRTATFEILVLLFQLSWHPGARSHPCLPPVCTCDPVPTATKTTFCFIDTEDGWKSLFLILEGTLTSFTMLISGLE